MSFRDVLQTAKPAGGQTRNPELPCAEHFEIPGSLALTCSRPGMTVLDANRAPYPFTRSTFATTALARNWLMIALRCLRS